MEGIEIAFELIMHAGNAKSKAMEAVCKSREGAFDEARTLLKEAEAELHSAHEIQTCLLTKMANGETVETNVLLTHAQDHLTMALMAMDFAEEVILLREEMRGKGVSI